MFALNEPIKRVIEKTTGLPVEKLSQMSADAIDRQIEKQKGKKLRIALPRDKRLEGRGSVYIALRRLLWTHKKKRRWART